MASLTDATPDSERMIEELRATGFVVTEWNDAPHATYEAHAHDHDEVRIVLRGEMTFVVGSRVFRLGPGRRIDLEAGEVHAARAGPAGATYLAGRAR